MYLQLDTKFNPFTYDEMVKPLLYYKQAYDEVDQAYAAIADQTSSLENIVNRDESPMAYEMFNRYNYELNNAINDFSKGMTAGTRRKLLGLRKRFASDIKPISTAYQRKIALQNEQRAAENSNPSMLWERQASDISLDDFINNPSMDYGRKYSGALLTQQVANAAANLAKEAQESDKGRVKLQKLLPYQYLAILRNGFSSDAVMQAILNSPNASQILTGLVESTIDSSGIRDWNNNAALARAYDYARQGLYNAIGQSQQQMITDKAGLTQLQYDLADRNNARQSERTLQAALVKKAMEDEDMLGGISASAQSFLKASGNYERYYKALNSLKAGNNGVAKSYFWDANNRRVIDPTAVRDALERRIGEINREADHTKNPQTQLYLRRTANIMENYLNTKRLLTTGTRENNAEAEINKIFNIYGVEDMINKDQYDALKAIGYDLSNLPAEQHNRFNETILNPLNALGKRQSYYSTNMSNYDHPDEIIRRNLGTWDNNDSFAGRVYKVEANGTEGEEVDFDDLELFDDEKPKNTITDISYSAFNPGKIIVTIGNKQYYMDPDVLGTEVGNMTRRSRDVINSNPNIDLTSASINTTIALAKYLNNYNPTRNTSSSKLDY